MSDLFLIKRYWLTPEDLAQIEAVAREGLARATREFCEGMRASPIWPLIKAAADDLDDVNSDPDAEERDPEDDTIGYPGDEMADWPLEGEEDDEDEG